MGRQGDGGWDVYMDPALVFQSDSCLVYDFGIGNIWEFDDELANKYDCDVRCFDPSINLQIISAVIIYGFLTQGLMVAAANGAPETCGPTLVCCALLDTAFKLLIFWR